MNPATRLLVTYNKLCAQSSDNQMVRTWADVFDIDRDSPQWEDDVTACVVALRAEIALTRQLLDAHEVPAHLTSPGFERLREVAAPGQLLSSHSACPQVELSLRQPLLAFGTSSRTIAPECPSWTHIAPLHFI